MEVNLTTLRDSMFRGKAEFAENLDAIHVVMLGETPPWDQKNQCWSK